MKNIKDVVKKYNGVKLQDDGAYLSEDFKEFAHALNEAFWDESIKKGIMIKSFDVGHYDISGFFTKGGKYVYFSYSPSRHMPLDLMKQDVYDGVLYRTAESDHDFTGGTNRFTNIVNLINDIDRLF